MHFAYVKQISNCELPSVCIWELHKANYLSHAQVFLDLYI